MNTKDEIIRAVPTNIITGFLGVGKTSAILKLLANKPDNERWAVLVNEFGEIGVDGSMFQGQHQEDSGVYIREVPGGCMCCAAGLPMQIALNQLLQRAKPDRLLIEPTGLGHPIEVLQILSSEHYQEVLSIHNIVTLVDARKLSDQRYIQHTTFNQQIEIADIIVGNKRDLYQPSDITTLNGYVAERCERQPNIVITQDGDLDIKWLAGKTTPRVANGHHRHHLDSQPVTSVAEQTLPACGYLKAENEGEGFRSVGWRFEPQKIFSRSKLRVFFSCLDVERMKAVFITREGIYSYNLTTDGLIETEIGECLESRIEIISTAISDEWQAQLLACLNGSA